MSFVLGSTMVINTGAAANAGLPMVGHHSVITAFNIFSPDDIGATASALGNPLTWNRFVSQEVDEVKLYIDTGEGAVPVVDYLGMSDYNCSLVKIEGTQNPDYETDLVTVLDDYAVGGNPFMLTFAQAQFRYYVVTIKKKVEEPSMSFYVGVLYLGRAMYFERCVRGQYAPLPLNRTTSYNTNLSETGQPLGRTIVRRGVSSSVSFNMMTNHWVRTVFQDFVRAARVKPYFFSWWPDKYPEEAGFVWTDQDIGASYTGDSIYMSASWTMTGRGYD